MTKTQPRNPTTTSIQNKQRQSRTSKVSKPNSGYPKRKDLKAAMFRYFPESLTNSKASLWAFSRSGQPRWAAQFPCLLHVGFAATREIFTQRWDRVWQSGPLRLNHSLQDFWVCSLCCQSPWLPSGPQDSGSRSQVAKPSKAQPSSARSNWSLTDLTQLRRALWAFLDLRSTKTQHLIA